MANYNHILIVIDAHTHQYPIEKVQSLAASYGARLSIGHYLAHIPLLNTNALNIEQEHRRHLQEQLRQLGKRYKIPIEDQWILEQNDTGFFELLNKNKIDLIIFSYFSPSRPLQSYLANKILQQNRCDICFMQN